MELLKVQQFKSSSQLFSSILVSYLEICFFISTVSRKSAKGVLKISKTITMTSDEQWKLPSDLTNVQSNDDLNSEDSEHDDDEPPTKKNKL